MAGTPGSTLRAPGYPVKRERAGAGALRCQRKFLRYYPGGFADAAYLALERSYKWHAHEHWQAALGRAEFSELLARGAVQEIAARAVRIESRTNLLFSFEKMALRDAVRSAAGARLFARGLHDFLYGPGDVPSRFERWREAIAQLPRRQTRVLSWPLLTVFGFIAQPDRHLFLKPNVTRAAARAYGHPFRYRSQPAWDTYASLLEFADEVRRDLRALKALDMIDLQSFIWVQGSDEYAE